MFARCLSIVAIAAFVGAPEVAHAQEWDADRYVELVTEGDALYDEGQAEDDADRRRELLGESARLKGEALAMLRDGLDSGALADFGDRPIEDYYHLQQNLIVLLVDIERCDDAAASLSAARDDPWLQQLGVVDELVGHVAERVEGCQVTEVAAAEPEEPDDPGEPVELPDPEPEGSGPNVGAIVVLSLSGAVAVGALIWDASTADDRDRLESLRNRCERVGCSPNNYAEGRELADDLDRTAVITGVMYGVALVGGVVGIVMLATGSDEASPPRDNDEMGREAAGGLRAPRVDAWFLEGGGGASVRWRF